MPIDYTTPTIAPPGAEEVAGTDPDDPAVDQYAPEQDAPDYAPDDDLGGYLSKASKAGMESPSRYSSPIIQQGLDLIRQQGQTAEEQSMATLGERMTQRGLVGSGIEATETGRLLEQLNQQRMGQEYGLLKDFAATESADRATWANIALQTRAQELQEQGMDADDAFREAQLEQSKYQFGKTTAVGESQFEAALSEQQAARLEEFGLSRDELNIKAAQIKEDQRMRGVEISDRKAQNEAEIAMRLKQLTDEAEFRGEAFDIERARMGMEQEQFNRRFEMEAEDIRNRAGLEGRQMTLAEARLQAERDWAREELGEARADRLSRAEISTRDLSIRADQIQKNFKISSKELARDYAELDMRRELQWQQVGLDKDRLEQSAAALRQEAKLAGDEMTLRESMQEAEIQARATELGSRQAAEQAMQNDRIQAERDMFREEMATRSNEFQQRAGLERDKYNLDKDNATREFSERASQRAHEMGLQEGSQQWEQQMELSSQLHERVLQNMVRDGSISIEKMRTDAEGAWREARNVLDKEIEVMERNLVHRGQNMDDARMAAERELERDWRNMDRQMEEKANAVRVVAQLKAAEMGMDAQTFEALMRVVASGEMSFPDTDAGKAERKKMMGMPSGPFGYIYDAEGNIVGSKATELVDLLKEMRGAEWWSVGVQSWKHSTATPP